MDGIGGSSSGAIAAFTVAWERPNDFRKVLSDVGSFVNLRGGHVYPEKVLSSEKKPIRVANYLTDLPPKDVPRRKLKAAAELVRRQLSAEAADSTRATRARMRVDHEKPRRRSMMTTCSLGQTWPPGRRGTASCPRPFPDVVSTPRRGDSSRSASQSKS
jgi:hypothetical protein